MIAAALIFYDAGIGVESLAAFFVLAIVNVGLVAALYGRH